MQLRQAPTPPRLVSTTDYGEGVVCNTLPSHVEWRRYGRLHRVDGPAMESDDGNQWWVDGHLHREDGPAIEYPGGHQEWWLNGKRHRADGPAIVLPESGSLSWYLFGQVALPEVEIRLLRAMDMPAIEASGEEALSLVGNDPWVAVVLLRNRAVMDKLPVRAAGFVALLASNLLA